MKLTNPPKALEISNNANPIPDEVMGEGSECTLKSMDASKMAIDEAAASALLNDLTHGWVHHKATFEPYHNFAEEDRTMRINPKEWIRSFEKKVLLWAMRKLGSLFSTNDNLFYKATKLGVLTDVSRTHLCPVVDFDELIAEAEYEVNKAFSTLVWSEALAEIAYFDMDHEEHDELIFEYSDDERDKINEFVMAHKDINRMSDLVKDEDVIEDVRHNIMENFTMHLAERLESLFNNCSEERLNAYKQDELKGYANQKFINAYIEARNYLVHLRVTSEGLRFGRYAPNFFEMSMLGRITTKTYLGINLDEADKKFLASVEKNPMYGRVIAAVENVDKS